MAQIRRLFARGGISRPDVGGGGADSGLLGRGLDALSDGFAAVQQRNDRIQAQRDDFWVTREEQKFGRDMLETTTALQDSAPENGMGFRDAANQAYEARLAASLESAPNDAARDAFRRRMETSKPDFDEALFGSERKMMSEYVASEVTQEVDDTSQVMRRIGQQGFDIEAASVSDRIAQIESGNVSDARNANSSATGKFQFVRGTWLETMKRHKPDLTNGKTDDEIWALATDDDLQDEMEGHFRNANVKHLAEAGFDASVGNVYLAHFAGRSGAVKALSASPDTPISKVLSRKAIEANEGVRLGDKEFKDFTAGDLVDWSRSKMGEQTSAQKDLNGVPVWNGPLPTPANNSAFQAGIQNVDEMLATMPGSRAMKSKLKKAAKAQITKAWLSGLAEKSPSQAMAALRSGRFDKEISLADDNAIEGIATSAYDRFEREIAAQQKKIEAARKEQQALSASILGARIDTGEASAQEVDAALAGGEIDHRQWLTGRRRAQTVARQNRAEIKRLEGEAQSDAKARLSFGVFAGTRGTDDVLTAMENGQVSIADGVSLLKEVRSEEKAGSAASEKATKAEQKRIGGSMELAFGRQALAGTLDPDELQEAVDEGFVTPGAGRAILNKNDSVLNEGSGEAEKRLLYDQAVSSSATSGLPADYNIKGNRDAADRSFVGQVQASDNPITAAVQWANTHNYVPPAMMQMVNSGFYGDDEQAKVASIEMVGQLVASDRTMARFFNSRTDKPILEAARLAENRPVQQAIQIAQDPISVSSPERDFRRKEFRDLKLGDEQWTAFNERIDDQDGSSVLSGIGIGAGDADVQSVARASFQETLENEYARHGDIDRAAAVAEAEFLSSHAVTGIGVRRWQRDAPERIYGIYGDQRDSEWIELQARGWAITQNVDIDASQPVMLSAPRSRRIQGYIVNYVDSDGVIQEIATDHFIPDPEFARAQAAELQVAAEEAAREDFEDRQELVGGLRDGADEVLGLPGTTRRLIREGRQQ